MYNPVSTYRIQFHKDFTFQHFEDIIPYLDNLGIKTIYASPIFAATPGSTHGYDGINPLAINPEIGTLQQLKNISQKLKSRNIGWLQDIVPNHMAFTPENKWLMDVLEKGPDSAYKTYFDQSLGDDFFKGPIMVPFLGSDLDEVIVAGDLKVKRKGEKVVFDYSGTEWPLCADSYPDKLDLNREELKHLAGQQFYRLCSWKETDYQINFRRFFAVNSLICLRMRDEEVFSHFHQLIKELIDDGIFDGLRIDHIDGLFDPTTYLTRLRKLCGDNAYIIVEKILEPGEQMPAWPIQGNTGYDFLAMVNNLLTNTKSHAAFTSFYDQLSGNQLPIDEQIREKKAWFLQNQMGGELENLSRLLSIDGDGENLKKALAKFLIYCPVYRYYGNQLPLNEAEQKAVFQIFEDIEQANPELKSAIKSIKNWLDKGGNDALYFYQRCMQFTGPVMAKGVEDTLMYTYNRFIAHNEVGDAPATFGIAVNDFHNEMKLRAKNWPLSVNGTSTHDTKRGEDARARLNVLTDIPDDWFSLVKQWSSENKASIDPNDEYFIYETLAGTYPMPGQPENDYHQRIEQYLEKTLREAKLHSTWAEPDEAYENKVKQFTLGLLDEKSIFWNSFAPFHKKIALFGVVNSLVQMLLKLTSPGMPDIYQGCELWDFSLVDPDNRRPVDYNLRRGYESAKSGIEELWEEPFNGQVKLRLLQLVLHEIKQNPVLFAEGDYLPLNVTGRHSNNVIAYARQYHNISYVVVAPLGLASISNNTDVDWGDTQVLLPENMQYKFQNVLVKKADNTADKIYLSAVFKDFPLAFLKFDLA
jgi:malto-oligosyltrehalose synthase